MVGAARFERATSCSQSRCATRLRYAPTHQMLARQQPLYDRHVAPGLVSPFVLRLLAMRLGTEPDGIAFKDLPTGR